MEHLLCQYMLGACILYWGTVKKNLKFRERADQLFIG